MMHAAAVTERAARQVGLGQGEIGGGGGEGRKKAWRRERGRVRKNDGGIIIAVSYSQFCLEIDVSVGDTSNAKSYLDAIMQALRVDH